MSTDEVVFLNPRTCGIYKSGGTRFKVDSATGRRTSEVDNEMLEQVDAYLSDQPVTGLARVPIDVVFDRRILVPTYYDSRHLEEFKQLCSTRGWRSVSLGEIVDKGIIKVRGGHGSPSNDARAGHIPYVKVSDIRSLRVNTNPTNLVSEAVAKQFWKGDSSGLQAWDLITPNRASSNIGEFAVLLPGEENVVITKEVFVIRVMGGEDEGWSPFYLLWALSLQSVREQWRRVALMQTNREDVGKRFREIRVPHPASREWADNVSSAFRSYFTTVADARASFHASLQASALDFIASATSVMPTVDENEEQSADAVTYLEEDSSIE